MNMLYQHAKYMYPDSMMVFKCKTHSCRKGKQREVERAANPTQQTPFKGKWKETDEESSSKDAAAGAMACSLSQGLPSQTLTGSMLRRDSTTQGDLHGKRRLTSIF